MVWPISFCHVLYYRFSYISHFKDASVLIHIIFYYIKGSVLIVLFWEDQRTSAMTD